MQANQLKTIMDSKGNGFVILWSLSDLMKKDPSLPLKLTK
jgi:hypothetical protein